MTLRTSNFHLEYFERGSPYYIDSERRRFTILDTQISAILKNFSLGVISGFNVTKSSRALAIDISDGLAIVPTFIQSEVNGEIVIEKSSIAVRSFKTSTLTLESFQSYLVYLTPLHNEDSSTEIVVTADKNVFRNAITTESGEYAYSKYIIDQPSINISDDNIEIYINGSKFLKPFTIDGQYVIFPNKRLDTDTVQVRVIPKDALSLAIIETGNNTILSIDSSVKEYVSTSSEAKTIPQSLTEHNHSNDGTELSLDKVKLTSKTFIVTGSAVPPESAEQQPNTIYSFQKLTTDDISGFFDSNFSTDFDSVSGTISSSNIRFDELINLQETQDIDYKGYFVNPDITQKTSSTILSTSNNGKNITSEDLLSSIIVPVFKDQYEYIIYPYELIIYINGIREYDDFWLIYDDGQTIQIQFSHPLENSDVVQAQLNLITELTQVKGLLETDALSEYSKKDVNAVFSASNINKGYLPPSSIPRVSHIGRSKELLIPIPTESDNIEENVELIYCDTHNRREYRPSLPNVPPLRNVKHITKIDDVWYICANNTLITSTQSRLFNDLTISNSYSNDLPIPLKTDYIGNEDDDNFVPIVLSEKSIFKKTETGWQSKATTSNFSTNESYLKEDSWQYKVPGIYEFKWMDIDHDNDNIFVSASKETNGNAKEVYVYANKDIDSSINVWNKLYSNNNSNIKHIAVHDGYIYLIIRENGSDIIKKTISDPVTIVGSQNGNILTINSSDASKFTIGGNLILARNGSVNEFRIRSISTNGDYSFLTLNRRPSPDVNPSEDLVFPEFVTEPNAIETLYDKIFSIDGDIYVTGGENLFVNWSPVLGSGSDFTTINHVSILGTKIVISTDDGIYYLRRTIPVYSYGYGFGYGLGMDFFDVFNFVGTRRGYGATDFDADELFESVFACGYGYGYGYERSFLGQWVKLSNETFDTEVNEIVENTNWMFNFEYNEDLGDDELYLACNDGVFQLESTDRPYDICIRNAFIVLGKPIDYENNVFISKFQTGIITNVDSGTNLLTVKANLKEVDPGDIITFNSLSGGVNANQNFRILSISNNNTLNDIYDIRVDRVDGKYTKSQNINAGDKFNIYPSCDPLVFINNNPQSSIYNSFYSEHTFDFHAQKITFINTLSPKDVVTAISKIKHLYALRGPWSDNLTSNEKVYLNNKYISYISGTWTEIKNVQYYDYSTGEKVLVKEILLETNSNSFFGFDLSGLTIIPNTNNPDDTYIIESNSFNSIRIRSDSPTTTQTSILTNSITGLVQSIGNVNFSINLNISLNNSVNILPFGNIGLITLPSPILAKDVARITIPNTSSSGYIFGTGTLTHEDIQNALSLEEDGLPHKFSGIKNANLIQYISALSDIMNVFEITEFENIEIDNLSTDRVIDLINSTIENSKIYEQTSSGNFSRDIFSIVYSSDLGGTYALADNGVYFKADSSDSNERWVQKANIVEYMSVSGNPTVPSEFKGFFLGYDKDSETWTIQWGEDFRLEDRNNGLNDHYINAVDIDPTDDEIVYFATKNHGLYRSLDGCDSSWEVLFNPGAFDSQNNINNDRYNVKDVKVYPSKNYVIFALLENRNYGGLFVSNDDGANFERYEITSQSAGKSGTRDFNCIHIPHIQDGSDSGISPMVYWGSNNLYRKQYGYSHGSGNLGVTGKTETRDGFVTNGPLQWKIDVFEKNIFDSNVRSDFEILDVAVRENNTNYIFISTSNGLYWTANDGHTLSGTINDYRFIGDNGTEVFSSSQLPSGEYIEKTKLWVSFDYGVPLQIFEVGKYFQLWSRPLELLEVDQQSSTRVILYFNYYDRNTNVFSPGHGFDNQTRGSNIKQFTSWNITGESIFNISSPTKLLYYNGILYVGTNGRGVFISTDNGKNFASYNSGFTDLIDDENLNISGFDFDSSGTIYCSARDNGDFGGGIFKFNGTWERIGGKYEGTSTDFTITDGMDYHDVLCFKVGKNDSNIIYAGTTNGVFKTENNGASWIQVALPTEYDNSTRFLSDNKTAFLGTQFSGVFKTKNKGDLWYQDYDPSENKSEKIRNTKKWRVWDLRFSGQSDSSENYLHVNTYQNMFSVSGIVYDKESMNTKYITQNNSNSDKTKVLEYPQKHVFIDQDVNDTAVSVYKNRKDISYYDLNDSYPGVLETLLYNSENQSYVANITLNSMREIPKNEMINSGVNNAPAIFKFQDSINNYRRVNGLLLDHTCVDYYNFQNSISTCLNRSGIFQEEKNYDVNRHDFRRITSDVSTKSLLSDYSICDICKHSSLDKYYIATENHGVFEVLDPDQITPSNFFRGYGEIGSSSTRLTDSRINFTSHDPTGSTITILTNSSSSTIVDQKTITGVVGTSTVSFSTSLATNGSSYFYVINDRFVSLINGTTNIQTSLNNPTLDDGEYYDYITDSSNNILTADVGKKIYIYDIKDPNFSESFVIEAISSGRAKIKRHRLSFRSDGETDLLFNSVYYDADNEKTVLVYSDFYKSDDASSSWVGMIIQPNSLDNNKFYKISSVNSVNKTISIDDSNGSIYAILESLNGLNSSTQVYSNIYYSIHKVLPSETTFSNIAYSIFDYATFTSINNGLSSFYSEYLDDNGNYEIDLKFNKLYFNSNVLYAATEQGVWKYDTSAVTPIWTEINTGISHYSIKDINGDGTYIFAASYGGGIYRTNNGSTWTDISGNLSHKKVWGLSIDPNNTNNIVIGTKGGGIYKTTTATGSSTTWTSDNVNVDRKDIIDWKIKEDPRNNSILYSWAYGAGVFKSTDVGASWTEINSNLTNLNVLDLDISPISSSKIIISTDGAGLFEYINNRWIKIKSNDLPHPVINRIVFSKSSANIYYVITNKPGPQYLENINNENKFQLYSKNNPSALYQTVDGGKTWNKVFEQTNLDEIGKPLDIDIDDSGNIYLSSFRSVYFSSNSAKTFTNETLFDRINIYRENSISTIGKINVNKNQTRNINLIGSAFKGEQILQISTDTGKTYRTAKRGSSSHKMFDIHSTTISKFSSTQTVTVSSYASDSLASITNAYFDGSAKWTQLLVSYNVNYTDDANADFGGALLNVSGESKRITLLNKPQNINDDQNYLFVENNYEHLKSKTFKIDALYSVNLAINDHNYLINYSMVNNHIKIKHSGKTNIYKIVKYTVSGTTATVVFVDSTETATTGSLSSAEISIGLMNINGDDIEDPAVIYSSSEGNFVYSLNYGYYWISPTTLENNSVAISTGKTGVQAIENGQDFTKSSKESVSFEVKNNKLYRSYLDDNGNLATQQLFTTYSNVLNEGLSRSFNNNSSYLYLSTSSNIYKIDSSLLESNILSGLLAKTTIQKPLKVSPSDPNSAMFFADNYLHITSDFSTWSSSNIKIDKTTVLHNNIKFIDFHPSDDDKLLLSININDSLNNSTSGLYLSQNKGGTWNKFNFKFFENESNPTLKFEEFQTYNTDRYYFNAIDDHYRYILTNNNGILGSNVNGFYYGTDFWIASTSDGITFYINDSSTTNEFLYKFYTFPLDYWLGNPTCMEYDSANNRIVVGSEKGIDFYDVNISDGVLTLSNHVQIFENLISVSVNSVKLFNNEGSSNYVFGTNNGIVIVPTSTYNNVQTFTNVDITRFTNERRSNKVVDIGLDYGSNRIIFITNDSIYIRENNGDVSSITPENSSLNEYILKSICVKNSIYYSIDYLTDNIQFKNIPTNFYDNQNIVVVKTIGTTGIEPPLSSTDYLNSIYGTISNVVKNVSENTTTITIDKTPVENTSIEQFFIFNPKYSYSEKITIQSINADSKTIIVPGLIGASAGDPYIIADAINDYSYVIYSGNESSFIDFTSIVDTSLTYAFYYKDSNGVYLKFHSITTNVSSSTLLDGKRSFSSPFIYVGSDRGILYVNNNENDVSQTSIGDSVNHIIYDQHGRILAGMENGGIISITNENIQSIKSISSDIDNYEIHGIFSSSFDGKVIVSSNEKIHVVDKLLQNVSLSVGSEYSYDEIKFSKSSIIPNLKVFYRESKDEESSLIVSGGEINIIKKGSITRTTNSRKDVVVQKISVLNDPRSISDDVLFSKDGENSLIVSTKTDGYVSFGRNEKFQKFDVSDSSKIYDIQRARLIGGNLFLSTDDYQNKFIVINNTTPYNLRPGQASNINTTILNSSSGLHHQDIRSVLYNTAGTAIWAGGFGSLYYREIADTQWTEVNYSTGGLLDPFFNYKELSNSSKTGNPIYAIAEYPNVKNTTNRGKESFILLVSKSTTFSAELYASGYSFEKDAGRYSLTFSSPSYSSQYFSSNRVKTTSLFGSSVSDGINDVGINCLIETNSGNNILYGSNKNNLRFLTYPNFYEKTGINKDVSLQVGYRSVDDDNFELPAAFEKSYISSTPGLIEKYKPVRCVNLFESDHDEDLLFASIFNPGELDSTSGKDIYSITNEKSLDHDCGYLLMSRDGGIGWSKIGHTLPSEAIISDVISDGNGNIYVSLFASTTNDCGVWRSTNYGKSFTEITRNLPAQPIKTMYFVENLTGYPEFGGILYVGLWGGGIWRLNTSEYGYGYGHNPHPTTSSYAYGYGYENTGALSFFDVFAFDFTTEQWEEIDFDIGFKRGKNLIGANALDISTFKNDYHESVWVATEEDGVLYSDSENVNTVGKTWIQKNDGLKTSSLTKILCSDYNEADVWLGTESGFYKLDTIENKWQLIRYGIPGNVNVTAISHDTYFYNVYISLTWTKTPGYTGSLVLRTTTSISTDVPIDNKEYSAGEQIGNSVIVYVGNGDYSSTPLIDMSSNLEVGKEYFYTFYHYLQSGSSITYGKFPNKLTAELSSYDVNSPRILSISTFEALVETSVYISNSSDRHYGETLVILTKTVSSRDIENLLAQKADLINDYYISYDYNGSTLSYPIDSAVYEGVFISGNIASTLTAGKTVSISSGLLDDELIGYVLNPSESQPRRSQEKEQIVIFEISDNTSTTITVKPRNDRKTIGSVVDLVVKEYRLNDGTVWDGNVVVKSNGNVYTEAFPETDSKRLFPIYGARNRGYFYRQSNTIIVLSDKLLRAQSITPLYVGTTSGIFRSVDNGESFEDKGLHGLQINSIAISVENMKNRSLQTANDATVYVSTSGGLYKSSNGGGTWTKISTGTFGSNNLGKIIIEIVDVNKNKEVIYINYPGNGIYKSEDNGTTWSVIESDTSSYTINDIDLSKINSKEFLLTTSGNGIVSYIEPNNEKFDIDIITDNKISSMSNVDVHLGDQITNYKDRISISSILRDSSYSNLKSLDFETDHEEFIEVSVKKNNILIPTTDINIGSNSINPQTNPFRINKEDDDHYPTHIFTTTILPGDSIFVGTNKGGFLSNDGGNSWERSGNYLLPSRIYASGVLDDDKLYIGTNNGVWISDDDGLTFEKDQMTNANVRAIWSYRNNGVTRFYIGGDFGIRIISKNDTSVTITTPETFDETDGIIFSWGEDDANGNPLPGGMPENFLEFLNQRREYWIPGASENPIFSTGWKGTLVVRNEGTSSDFVPNDDAEYGKKYRRFIEEPDRNTFWDDPPIRAFPDGLVIVDNILNNSNVLDTSTDSFISATLEGQNTFTNDNPFTDEVHVTSEFDRNIKNKWGAYPDKNGGLLDLNATYEFGNGSELKAETSYTYTFFAYFLRPVPIPYDLLKIGSLYREYYQYTPTEYSYDIKIRNIPSAKMVTCGDSLSIDEWVCGTDDGAFYSSSGVGGLKKSDLDGVEVTAIKFYTTTDFQPIYGYGFGYSPSTYDSLSYFDVFDVTGILSGYGSSEFNEDFSGKYGYGWGYENRYIVKVYAACSDGIYVSASDRGVTYTKIYDFSNTEFNIVHSFTINGDNELLAATNAGILKKSLTSDVEWTLIDPVIGNADSTYGGIIIGQSLDLLEI